VSGARESRATAARLAARRTAQFVVAVTVTLAVVGLSRVPYAAVQSEDGELRLAWRFRSERVSACRKLSDAEQAALPAHMRRQEDCTRGLRPYRLTVEVGATAAAAVTGEAAAVSSVDTIRARGAESDRPLFVFRRIPLAPGRYVTRVEFAPVGLGGSARTGAGDEVAGRAPAGTEGRTALRLDTTLTIGPRRVVLVTYDDDAKRMVVRMAVPVR